ncbi:MAG: UvrD-helicase domain-containing protein, partial [Bacteroidota bacterium]|nr:UvrD-helicase domain-containing protein [Bacteroidota bacterium]
MQFTPEQEAIIASTGDIKINAVAGSGKTTTVVAYARSRPADARILYLAFNKSVRQEAIRKFAQQGLHNVQVETAHSLAYRHVMKHSGYQLHENGGYKPYELAELLRLPKMVDAKAHAEYVLANHVGKFLTYFCNSSKDRVQELNYLDTVADPKAQAFVRTHYALIERSCRLLLKRMNAGEVPISHDFYLKRFQLDKPKLAFDYILFDEGQDASGAMLDFFLHQEATKVIVGDTHQQIYGWRHAVNALEKSDFTTFQLSTSFRFGAPVAELATQVLTWKNQLGAELPFPLSGHGGGTNEPVSKAVISRTNINLLAKAIEYLTHHNSDVQRLYFEGNLNSYTYADTGGSLFDVLSLYNGRSAGIRDPLIKRMANLFELEEYARETEDGPLLM